MVASALGRVANRTARFVVRSDETLDGFPRWRWVLSAFTQAVVFPAIMFMVWRTATVQYTFGEWLALSSFELSGWARWYVYALFASQTRDMFPMPAAASSTMKVHHWLVIIACVLSLAAPAGFGLFVVSTFILELGSLTFNLRKLYPKSFLISIVYQACMFASNVAAVAGGVVMLGMPSLPMWMKLLYFVADVGVCIGRQRHAFKEAGLLRHQHPAGEGSVRSADHEAVPGTAMGASQAPSPRRSSSGRQWTGCQWVAGLPLLPLLTPRRWRQLPAAMRPASGTPELRWRAAGESGLLVRRPAHPRVAMAPSVRMGWATAAATSTGARR